ncbi:glycosyltransferase family 4 protein [Ferriphaselus sp. R-1]|uniref:glycosyltransferase family 4 protein n=1 Tax=Ferriphaselus sp. R-1 TaxID=1485544 RepID=UPI0006893757|nr:glycosyltransferase family 4 protein [Ferriphaselus sp. R-1]
MEIIHIVRRYGPVGGSERYVWELTRELAALGHRVMVVCERCDVTHPAGIEVHALGTMVYRPRWLYYWRFSRRVDRWLAAHPHPGWLIHSHERVGVHHVSTFHGPPFASVRERPWWKKLSLRIWAQLYLERRELDRAQAIIPNSEVIRGLLARYYPEYAHKLTSPVVPGVAPGVLRPFRHPMADGGVIGFVGKEWQRKGLSLAVDIAAHLRRKRPQLEIWVVGPRPDEIEHLFAGWQGGFRLLGWRTDADHLRDFDVLLHPARAEPYGMVISEAMAACVPVVVSDACGAAAQVGAESGVVLPLGAELSQWVQAVERQLQRSDPVPAFRHGWSEVAQECVEIYRPQLPNGPTLSDRRS